VTVTASALVTVLLFVRFEVSVYYYYIIIKYTGSVAALYSHTTLRRCKEVRSA